mgnify:CR=1 FL=1
MNNLTLNSGDKINIYRRHNNVFIKTYELDKKMRLKNATNLDAFAFDIVSLNRDEECTITDESTGTELKLYRENVNTQDLFNMILNAMIDINKMEKSTHKITIAKRFTILSQPIRQIGIVKLRGNDYIVEYIHGNSNIENLNVISSENTLSNLEYDNKSNRVKKKGNEKSFHEFEFFSSDGVNVTSLKYKDELFTNVVRDNRNNKYLSNIIADKEFLETNDYMKTFISDDNETLILVFSSKKDVSSNIINSWRGRKRIVAIVQKTTSGGLRLYGENSNKEKVQQAITERINKIKNERRNIKAKNIKEKNQKKIQNNNKSKKSKNFPSTYSREVNLLGETSYTTTSNSLFSSSSIVRPQKTNTSRSKIIKKATPVVREVNLLGENSYESSESLFITPGYKKSYHSMSSAPVTTPAPVTTTAPAPVTTTAPAPVTTTPVAPVANDTNDTIELTRAEIQEIESEIGNQVDINGATRVVATELLKYIII